MDVKLNIIRVQHYAKYFTWCHLLFAIMQCYNYSLYISYFANNDQIGGLNIIGH